jgi:C-1 hydroxylase
MKRAELQVLLDRHTRAWNQHDVETLAARHAEDGILVSPMFGTVTGRDQITRTYTSVFLIFPDWQISFDPPIIDGDRLAHPFTVTATQQGEFMGMAGTGRHCTFDGVSLVRLTADGLVAEERRRYDFTGLLTQIGVLRVKLGK